MSDLIRMYGMKASQGGVCRKCGLERGNGNHTKCDRWPSMMSMNAGFHHIGNSHQTTLGELKKLVALICMGDDDDTPVQYDIRIRQIFPKEKR